MKFSKRILSIILSVLMVVTSIPVFAVTVSADTVSVDKIGSLVYFNEGVSDKSSQPVYSKAYDGTQTDKNNGYTISAKFNVGNTINGNSIVFSIGNSSDGNNTSHYLTFREDGSFHLNYDGHYYDSWNVDTFGFSLSANTDYQLTVSVAPYTDSATGNTYEVLRFYLDGSLLNVYDTKTTFTNYDKNYTTCEYLSKNWDVSYGKGCNYWNDSNDGSVADFAVFNDVLSPNEIYSYIDICKRDYTNLGSTLESLKSVMTEYEEVMRNSGVTKINLLDAYNAYTDASKIYDAVYYGKSSLDSTLIQNAVCNLAAAIDLMTEVPVSVKGTDVPLATDVWFSSSNNIKYLLSTNNRENNKVFNNVLYAGDWNKNGMSINSAGRVTQKLFAADNPVILYNGSDDKPVIPIMISSYNGATSWNQTRRFWYCAPVEIAGQHANNNMSTEWSLIKSGWYGGSTNGDWAWMFDAGWDGVGSDWSDIERFPAYYNDDSNNAVVLTKGADNSFVNAVQFDGTPTQISTTYAINFALGCGGDNLADTTYPVYSNVRVINYKALTDAVSSKILSYDVSSYTYGGLTELFTAIDNAMSIDPQSYFLDGTDSRYDECVNAITSAINTINSISPTIDGTGYQEVRELLDAAIGVDEGIIYTTKSYDDYQKMIEVCRAYMAAVYSGNIYNGVSLNSGYSYNSDMVALADAASNVLNAKVDFTELKDLVEDAKKLDIFDENGVQTKTLESWVALQEKILETETEIAFLIDNVGQYGVDEDTVVECTAANITYDRINLDKASTAFAFNNENLTYYKNSNNLLEDVPKEQIEAFDAAYEVGSTVPVTVYEPQAREEQMQAMEDARAEIYMSAEEAASVGYTFPEGVEKQELVYLSDAGSVDAQTTAVLTAISTLDGSKAEFTVSVNGVSDGKTYTYGDPYTLEGQPTNGEWKIKYGDNKTINIYAEANTPVELIIEDNVVATFDSKEIGDETQHTVYIYDGYGKLVEIRYENSAVTEDYGTKNLTAATVPFYDFTGWKFETETTEDSKTIYKFTPQYTAQDDGTVLIQQEGKDVKRASFDTAVTLTSDGTNYGWVNKIETETGTVKYQIVSYSTDKFKSYAISPCNYYPFYKDVDNGTYYVMDGEIKVTLTDQNVDGDILPDGQNVGATANEHLNFKLDNKYPFAYTEKAVVVENATPDSKGRYRVYARFTDGADKYESFGVRVIVGDGKLDGKFTCNGKATSNQYAFTLNLTQNQVTGVDNITFKPYVNHYFEYSGKRVDAFYTSEIVLNINAEQGGV